jgi:DNA-directed RNA polymerase I, II, and III subunit RPABC2
MADEVDDNLDYEQEEWAEEYAEGLPEEEVTAEVKPELKRLYQQHPECLLDYVGQVLTKLHPSILPPGGVSTDPEKPTTDPNHRTYPFLTNFERTKMIGLRANQISKGSAPFIAVPSHITDVRDIARMELEQKRLPYIIKRPLPDGSFEYWRLADLLILQ